MPSLVLLVTAAYIPSIGFKGATVQSDPNVTFAPLSKLIERLRSTEPVGRQVIDFNPIKFDFNYLQEKEHLGDQEYFKGKIGFSPNEYGLFSAETKRNLITNSAEYYNLSYEYTNDCLRAGLVYRREFYNDSELEPENSLMFNITLSTFGNVNSPKISR